jgi:predicted nucleic acid-binding protein
MSFLLDTNAISEWQKPRPDRGVLDWMNATDENSLFLSVVTLAELRYGIERMDAGGRRRRYELWLEHELPLRFEGRILSVNPTIADMWGRLVARGAAAGRPVNAMDAFLAATAEVHRLTLVTRNVSHFTLLKTVVNPWAETHES